MEQQQQAQALKRKPHVVVATPGRLAALLETDSSLAAGETAGLALFGGFVLQNRLQLLACSVWPRSFSAGGWFALVLHA